MRIKFRFDPDKAVQVMAYFVQKLGPTDKVKLMKLVYLADREHFTRFGFPITGDRLCAMQHGPVPSSTLNVINGDIVVTPERIFRYLHVDDNRVELRASPGIGALAATELEVLNEMASRHGGKPTWDLVRETHGLPEYTQTFVEGTSTTIPFELIARHSGVENRFRLNRPVIGKATAERMACPLDPDTDL